MRTLDQSSIVEQRIDGLQVGVFRKELHRVPLERGGALGVVRKLPPHGRARAAVVLIHGYAQNRYAWHLSRRSLSSYLARAGYDVWNVDLRGCGRSRALGAPFATHFEDHVAEDIPRTIEAIEAATGDPAVFLVGHSLGGAIACAVAGRAPERVRGVVTLAGLWRFGRGSRFIRFLGAAAGALRAAAPFLCRPGLPLPTRHVGRFLALSRAAWDSPLAALAPMHAWARGSVEPEVILECVTRSFEPASMGVTLGLAAMALGGTFCGRDGRCYLKPFASSGVPLFAGWGARDSLISPEDARGAYDLSRANDRTWREFDAGHIDIIMGREAPARVWPEVRRWLDARAPTR